MKLPSAVLTLVLTLYPVMARADAVDDYVQDQMHRRRIPGLSLAIIREGAVIKAKGYGLADVARNRPAEAATVYPIGSLTKQFTAAAIMMLMEERRFSLDDRISARLDGVPDAWATVTVRQALTHTSGIPDYTERPDFGSTSHSARTPRQLVEAAAAMTITGAPGEKWRYSNTNYVLLAMLVERYSGQRFGDFLFSRIFRPLGMTQTQVPERSGGLGQAQGYTRTNMQMKATDGIEMSIALGGGDIVSTVADMAKWDAALGEKLLKPESWKQVWTPAILNDGKAADYGFGWTIRQVNGHRLFSHGGNISGFGSGIVHFPDDHLSVILLTNFEQLNGDALAQGIAGVLRPDLGPAAVVPIPDPDPAQSAHLRAVYLGMMTGVMDKDSFAPAIYQDLGERIAAGAEDARARFADAGPIQSFVLISRKQTEQGLALQYRVTQEYQLVDLFVTLDAAGKIANWGVRGTG